MLPSLKNEVTTLQNLFITVCNVDLIVYGVSKCRDYNCITWNAYDLHYVNVAIIFALVFYLIYINSILLIVLLVKINIVDQETYI